MDFLNMINAVSLQKILILLLAVLAVGLGLYFLLRRLMRHTVRSIREAGDHLIRSFFQGLSQIDTHEDEKPKSLPSMENLLLPKVLRDFPDFDLAMAKNNVRDHLEKIYGDREEFEIHNVVLADYRTASVKKVLVFYAAVGWRRERMIQKRLSVSMEFQCVNNKLNPAINCPNCGATLGFGDLTCKYCGTRINDRRDQEWAFASIKEV